MSKYCVDDVCLDKLYIYRSKYALDPFALNTRQTS